MVYIIVALAAFAIIRVLFWSTLYILAKRRYRRDRARFETECAKGIRPTWVPRYEDPRGSISIRPSDLARTEAYHTVYALARRIVEATNKQRAQ